MGDPATRSNVERAFFGLLEDESGALVPRLEAHLEPHVFATARDASMLGWTPFASAVAFRQGLREVVGDDAAYVELTRKLGVRSLNKAPFNTLSAAILRIYEASPASLVRAYRRIWNTVYRNVASYDVREIGEGHARVALAQACELARTQAFILYTRGVLLAVVDIAKGHNAQSGHEVVDDCVLIDLRWG